MIAYRVTTHDLRPPVQGGEPVPHVPGECLPLVVVDASETECAPGRSACRAPHDALRVAGLWPDGRPSRLWRVESVAGHDPIERRGKLRAATWRVLDEEPVTDAIIADLHRPLAGEGLPIDALVAEVQAWRVALARPRWDEAAVEAMLRAALAHRGLTWSLRRFPTAWATWAARDARDARATWAAMAARDARDARAAWAARDPWDPWAAVAARDARAAWDPWAAVAARDALITYGAAHIGVWRTPAHADLLTAGIRDAYRAGLAAAIPTGQAELGWAMVPQAGVTP